MSKSRIALGIAILLAVLLPLALVAQTDTQPAQSQDQQMGEHHEHMGRMGGPMDPQAHLDHLSKMLNLSDDQKVKIKPIIESTDAQAQSIHQDTSLSPQDRRTKMRDLHEKSMVQIRGILTPEQQAKLDQMQKHEGMGRGKGMGHGQGMGPGGQEQQQKPPQ
jgi:periplasmic protein CpxP/Spy